MTISLKWVSSTNGTSGVRAGHVIKLMFLGNTKRARKSKAAPHEQINEGTPSYKRN